MISIVTMRNEVEGKTSGRGKIEASARRYSGFGMAHFVSLAVVKATFSPFLSRN
jgi:hypothetical protein